MPRPHRNPPASDNTHVALRRRMRQRRRDLPEGERRLAARNTAALLQRLGAVRRAGHIAVYLAVDGELDLEPAITALLRHGKLIYLPVVRGNRLRFAPFQHDSDLRKNRLGIPEPAGVAGIGHGRLDVVLAPLVAFDDHGTRVGMGGGHYDRSFGFLRSRWCWQRPKLIGIGYEFQRIDNIERRPWDVPLWAAVTDREIHRF